MKDKGCINWGMIGCGDVTEVKNGPGLYLAKNSILKGVWNRTKEKAESWVKRHAVGKVYNSIEELLADSEIDIVYIATTPDTHMQYALMCAKAGKHCLIEKPLARDFEEGKVIQEAFDKAGKKVFVAFYRRSMNRFVKINELLKNDAIGKLKLVSICRYVKKEKDSNQWRLQPKVSGGNVFSETDIHILDFLDMIVGNMKEFSYHAAKADTGSEYFDTLSMSFLYESGVVGSGRWNYCCEAEYDRVELVGERGIISFDFFDNSQPIIVRTADKCEEYVIEDSLHVGLNMEQQIVQELLQTGSFTGNISAALRTLKITSEIIAGSLKVNS